MKWLLLGVIVLASSPAAAQSGPCTLTVRIITGADHGSLPAGSELTGQVEFVPTGRMRMGQEAVSYPSEGRMVVTAPDGTAITGELGFIHVVRAPHWADYISFDVTDVAGDLGGVVSYEDPMLLTFYADRGSLESFDLPRGTDAWRSFDFRQSFQVHTPDTMWTLPGQVSGAEDTCN